MGLRSTGSIPGCFCPGFREEQNGWFLDDNGLEIAALVGIELWVKEGRSGAAPLGQMNGTAGSKAF
jgi:hypothetical protein